MIRNRDEWETHMHEQGSSGEMAWDILEDWKEDRQYIAYLESRIEAMNDVFGKVRMEVGGNTAFDGEPCVLTEALLTEIDGVMAREERE